jgi:hypothetical protein
MRVQRKGRSREWVFAWAEQAILAGFLAAQDDVNAEMVDSQETE